MKSFLLIFLLTIEGLTSQSLRGQQSSAFFFDIVVAQDGSGQFKTVQDALNVVPDRSEKRTTIYIKKGVYKEKLTLATSKINVTMIGESVDSVVLTYDDHSGKKIGNDTINTFTSQSFIIEADGFTAENITFENSAGRLAGQAVAVKITGDRVIFKHCRFIGNQDTFFTQGTGRCYVDSCYIEGTTDFIFGSSIAVFNNCILHSKKNSHVTAASTPQGNKFGYVFFDCQLTSDDSIKKVSLGRPWRPFARVVYIRCNIGSHIIPEGWNNWRNPENEKTAFYAEYKCNGPGYKPSERVTWSHQLTDDEAAEYTLKKIFEARSAVIPYSADWIPYGK